MCCGPWGHKELDATELRYVFLIMYNFLQRGLAHLLLDLFTDFGIFEVIVNSNIADICLWLVFRSSMLSFPPTSLLNSTILIVYL